MRVAIAVPAVVVALLCASRHARAQATLADSAQRVSARGDSASRLGTAAGLRQALALKAHAARLFRELGDRQAESRTTREVGMLESEAGRPDSALARFHAALAIDRGDGDRAGESETLHELGATYANTGRPDSALRYLRLALPIERETGNRTLEAETTNSIGFALRLLGSLDSALVYYARAIDIFRQLGKRDSEGATLNNIGRVYGLLSRNDSAAIYYKESLAIRRALGDRRGEAITLNNLSGMFSDIGRLDSARHYLQLVLPIRREVGDRRGEGVTLGSLAGILQRERQWDSALVYYRLALAIHRETRNRSSEGPVLNSVGLVFQALGVGDSARWYLDQSLALRRELRDPIGEGFTLENLGFLYRTPGRSRDLVRSTAYYDSASAVLDAVTRGAGSELNRLNWTEYAFRAIPNWSMAWLAQAPSLGARDAAAAALAVGERGRAQAVLQLMRDTTRVFRVGTDFPAEGRRLAGHFARSGSAALVYMMTLDTLLVWVIRPDSSVEVVRLPGSADSIAASIEMLRNRIGGGEAARLLSRGGVLEPSRAAGASSSADGGSWTSASAKLADALLPPRVLALLAGVREVVIVPHGTIALVPFAALAVGRARTPFGAGIAVRYAPSLATLEQAESRPVPVVQRAIVVGNPAMPNVAVGSGARDVLAALPGAEAEARAVAARLGTTLLTGAAASETEVRRRLGDASVIHLATHGFAYSSESKARQSFVALAPDSTHDGLLTVGEIAEMPGLRLTADLVVLSACQTGLGDLRLGEGTIGLQRAFLAKGARSVLVSLWNVSDAATAALMTKFYAHWRDDRDRPNKAEALRRAQEDVRMTPGWEHPRHWAAFQLVGAR